jgi:hypothetical protein
MASGKQLSFIQGEVAPSQRFKSDGVTYSQALSKLRNMYVRRDGGVSNRAGFRTLGPSPYQEYVNTYPRRIGVRTFSEGITIAATPTRYILLLDGQEITQIAFNGEIFSGPGIIDAPVPDYLQVTRTKDGVFVPGCYINQSVGGEVIGPADVVIDSAGIARTIQRDDILRIVGMSESMGYAGQAPFMPVSYYITAIMKDGREVRVRNRESTGAWDGALPVSAVAGNIYHPHVSLQSRIVLTFPNTTMVNDVKFFNIYRASGNKGPGQSFYKLAGRINNDGAATTFEFTDYGADSPGETPPLDRSLFTGRALTGGKVSCYYQQRLLTTAQGLKPGEMAASALGATRQLVMPVISSDTGAFRFSVPLMDESGVRGALSMERAVLMTGRGVYVVRGGEQGMLTPTMVNPLKISDEGCSNVVRPVSAGIWGFWVNAAHTKLMALRFSEDGNIKLQEASLLSNHFLQTSIRQLEAISGETDSVFAVTDDGRLIQVSVTEEGFGFSWIETAGHIESIFRGSRALALPGPADPVSRDVIFAYVIRNGVRFREYIEVREDRFRQTEYFADACLPFGCRLVRNWDGPDYIKDFSWTTHLTLLNTPSMGSIRIMPGAHSWQAGETIKVRSSTNLLSTDMGGVAPEALHFYDSQDRPLRYLLDTAVPEVNVGGGLLEFEGHFTADVPLELQDTLTSRWAPALRRFSYPKSADTPLSWFMTATKGMGAVTIVGEGNILSSPLNPHKETIYIEDDGINYIMDLGDYYAWGYVGLPYVSEFETLDLEVSDARTLTDSRKLLNRVGLGVMETRGGFFGMPDRPLEEMAEVVLRTDGDITQQTKNIDGHLDVIIPSEWTQAGRVNIKNVDPVPMTILSIYPKGMAGD